MTRVILFNLQGKKVCDIDIADSIESLPELIIYNGGYFLPIGHTSYRQVIPFVVFQDHVSN